MAGDVGKTIGRKKVEHERPSRRLGSDASQKSNHDETLSNEMSSREDGSSAYACLSRTACSTICLL